MKKFLHHALMSRTKRNYIKNFLLLLLKFLVNLEI